MTLPNDRKYTSSHEWIKADGDAYIVGITDNAQDQLGDLVFVGEVEVGNKVAAGDQVAVVESVKAASDIYAPIAGEILEVNQELVDAPDTANTDPYGAAWFFRIKPANAADLDGLMDAAAYEAETN